MKKNHAYRVDCYTVYSDKKISILKLRPVIFKAKGKEKIGKVFQYKKQKYLVVIENKNNKIPLVSFMSFTVDGFNEKEWEKRHA